jgi:hypothetical protein
MDALTANKPIAVTTLLFSLLIMLWYVLVAKLGSASVRPPLAVFGGMAATAWRVSIMVFRKDKKSRTYLWLIGNLFECGAGCSGCDDKSSRNFRA